MKAFKKIDMGCLMLKPMCTFAMMGLLIGCGGSRSVSLSDTSPSSVTRSASGPVASACLSANRRDASPALCGCIQAAANLTLTRDDQRRSTRYFNEPDLLQATKVSDSRSNEAFWDRWAAFRDQANSMCSDR